MSSNRIFFLFSLILLVAISGCTSKVPTSSTGSTALVALSCSSSATPYGGGSGSVAAPYLICSAAQLLAIDQNMSSNFLLTADLNLTSVTFSPIGTSDADTFTGTFDGGSHTISHLSYANTSDANSVGLFRVLDSGSTVKNLNLQIDLFNGNNIVGGVAGYAIHTTLNNVSVTGTLNGNATIGGAIGEAVEASTFTNVTTAGTVYSRVSGTRIYSNGAAGQTDCGAGGVLGIIHQGAVNLGMTNMTNVSSSATVTWNPGGSQGAGWVSAGGILGYGAHFSCINCTSTGSITGYVAVSGIAGALDGSDNIVTNATVTGTMTGGDSVAGVVGSASSGVIISESSFIGTLSSTGDSVGGILGGGCGDTVRQSFVKANITGNTSVGGVIGSFCVNDVEDSYAIGSVTVTNTDAGQSNYGGAGIAGSGWSTCTANHSFASVAVTATNGAFIKAFGDYYCTPTTSSLFYRTSVTTTTDTIALGLSDVQMVSSASYTGFDFTNIWKMPLVNPLNNILTPVLAWQCGKNGVVCP